MHVCPNPASHLKPSFSPFGYETACSSSPRGGHSHYSICLLWPPLPYAAALFLDLESSVPQAFWTFSGFMERCSPKTLCVSARHPRTEAKFQQQDLNGTWALLSERACSRSLKTEGAVQQGMGAVPGAESAAADSKQGNGDLATSRVLPQSRHPEGGPQAPSKNRAWPTLYTEPCKPLSRVPAMLRPPRRYSHYFIYIIVNTHL